MLLSRAVRASPDTEKQKVRKNPAIPDTTANAINKNDHNLLFSSAVRGSVKTFWEQVDILSSKNQELHKLNYTAIVKNIKAK